jgi:hypothetical protein
MIVLLDDVLAPLRLLTDTNLEVAHETNMQPPATAKTAVGLVRLPPTLTDTFQARTTTRRRLQLQL